MEESSNKRIETEKILKCAAEIFSKFGYQKTSMADIAREMGKTKTYLYYYFKDKETIFSTIIEEEAKTLFIKLVEETAKGDNLESKMTGYIIARFSHLQLLSDRYSNLKSELLTFLPLIERKREKYNRQEIELVYSILNIGSTSTNEKIYKKAKIVVNINKAMEIPLFVRNSMVENSFKIDDLIELILYGLT